MCVAQAPLNLHKLPTDMFNILTEKKETG